MSPNFTWYSSINSNYCKLIHDETVTNKKQHVHIIRHAYINAFFYEFTLKLTPAQSQTDMNTYKTHAHAETEIYGDVGLT